MAPSPPRLRILSVGGNAVSAFLSWRLQATNACDVTLVWKANYQAVAQYGISFRSEKFGNERFKPRFVVQSPEDAASHSAAFDYVILCVKALPDVYNLADIVQSVVTPQHTCILVNTTNTLGVERQLEERFPTNVVLSLVSGADLTQLGSSEFEHNGSTELWVGPANVNASIPEAIQKDMSEALAMTLNTGQVECHVSSNIRQQQYERMIGPIAFHPASVLFETPALAELLQKPGVRELVTDVISEMTQLAAAHRCSFPSDFAQKTIQSMVSMSQDPSTMFQDFSARRPMEVETYLGSPVELAKAANVRVPRIETLYALLRNVNTANKDRPPPPSPTIVQAAPSPRVTSVQPPPRQPNGHLPNGAPRPPRGPSSMGGPMGPPMGPNGRRGPPPVNGFRGPPPGMQRRPSFDESNLDEFSHVVLYDDMPDGEASAAYGDGGNMGGVSLRERELMLREREMQLRQQEMAMRGGRGGRRPAPSRVPQDFDDDDEDGDDYFDPMQSRMPPPNVDVDNLDMMSVTSRRTKRAPSQGQMRKDMHSGGMMRGGFGRPFNHRNRASTQMMSDMPSLRDNILDNPMMGFSSNRYGAVDRKEMQDESRTNSLTAARLQEIHGGGGGPYPGPNNGGPYPGPNNGGPYPGPNNGGPFPGPPNRRTSRSPGNPFSPMGRPMGRPSPPQDAYMHPPPGRNGRPSPPGMVQAPTPRYPPGQGNMVHPQQVEQQVGVSKPYPPKVPTKSLTGSASASAGSGDSASANIESEPSAHSSTSSFAPRAMFSAGVH